jgi:uncharacterized protein
MIVALVLAASVSVPARPSDYVTDTVHALSSRTADAIRDELRAYYDASKNRILVYVSDTTGDTPLEDWTVNAAQKWKIPGTGDRGAVLFVFMRDHKVRIEVGYGLESSLTDADSSRIVRDTILPKMRAGDVDGAIRDGVDRMVLTITPSFRNDIGHDVAPANENAPRNEDIVAFLIIGLIFFAILAFLISAMASRRSRSAWLWGSGVGGGYGGWGGWSGGGSSGGGFSGFSGGGSGISFGGGGASGSW